MTFKEIIAHSVTNFSQDLFLQINDNSNMPIAIIDSKKLEEYCLFLLKNKELYFDFLECITAIDNGLEKNTMEIVYNFYSIVYNHKIAIKVVIDRNNPIIDSLSLLWRTANWHEREIFDLFGIHFANHPDLRRILNPEDWQGFPLRKDYVVQDMYHDIKVKY